MKKLIVLSMFASSVASGNEFEKYLKLDPSAGGGGYVTLTEEDCEIPKISDPYTFKAKIETKEGTRRACWNTHVVPAEKNGEWIPLVHVVEEEILDEDTTLFNIATIPRYHFKSEKE